VVYSSGGGGRAASAAITARVRAGGVSDAPNPSHPAGAAHAVASATTALRGRRVAGGRGRALVLAAGLAQAWDRLEVRVRARVRARVWARVRVRARARVRVRVRVSSPSPSP